MDSHPSLLPFRFRGLKTDVCISFLFLSGDHKEKPFRALQFVSRRSKTLYTFIFISPRAQKSAHWSPKAPLYQIRIVQHTTAIKLSGLSIKLSASSSAGPAACTSASGASTRSEDAPSPETSQKLTQQRSAGLGGRCPSLIHYSVCCSLVHNKTRWQWRAGAHPLPGTSIELNHLVWQTLNA